MPSALTLTGIVDRAAAARSASGRPASASSGG